jgi:predicted methyltransferase
MNKDSWIIIFVQKSPSFIFYQFPHFSIEKNQKRRQNENISKHTSLYELQIENQ